MSNSSAIAAWAVFLLVYWSPTIIAITRRINGLGQVIVVNFFGWFLLFPWVIALVMAFRSDTKPKHGTI